MTTSNFNIFIPATITKGGAASQEMILSGVASTSTKDDDNDVLLPKGFDISYLMSKGYINWNHKTNENPLAIIGKPTKNTKVVGNKLYVEAKLFKGHPVAEQAYQLQQILQAAGEDGLGWSIEGNVLERDEAGRITKARITGCALTPNPKNSDSVVEIIKSESFTALDSSPKMDTGKADAVMPESLNSELKDTQSRPKKKKKNKNIITKSQAFSDILEEFPSISLSSANRVFEISKHFTNQTNMAKGTTNEALNKALNVLGLMDKGQEVSEDEICKALDIIDQEGLLNEEGRLVKAISNASPEEEEEEEDPKTDLKKGGEEEEEEEEEEPVTKSEKKDKMMKGAQSEAFTNQLKSIIDPLIKSNEAMVLKNEKLETELSEMKKLISDVSSAPGLVKSVRSASFLHNKEEESNSGKQLMSASQNKQEILKSIESRWYDGRQVINKQLADEVCLFESTNQLSKGMVDTLSSMNIKVVA